MQKRGMPGESKPVCAWNGKAWRLDRWEVRPELFTDDLSGIIRRREARGWTVAEIEAEMQKIGWKPIGSERDQHSQRK